MLIRRRRTVVPRIVPLLGLVLAACGKGDDGVPHARGPGLEVATLGVNQEAAVNAAAVSAAFNPDPALSLLIDPVYLPRTAGREGGASVAPALIARMKQIGTIRGTCQIPRENGHVVPTCPARISGYVVRFSQIFQLGKSPDSVQVYLAATRYRHAPKEPAELLSFERAYRLAKIRGEWRVWSEARIPQRRN
jgi:hypothetical protein